MTLANIDPPVIPHRKMHVLAVLIFEPGQLPVQHPVHTKSLKDMTTSIRTFSFIVLLPSFQNHSVFPHAVFLGKNISAEEQKLKFDYLSIDTSFNVIIILLYKKKTFSLFLKKKYIFFHVLHLPFFSLWFPKAGAIKIEACHSCYYCAITSFFPGS